MGKQLYIVGVDGSEWAQRAAAKAISLARQTGAEVKLVSVIPWSGLQPLTLEEISNRPLEKQEEEQAAHAKFLDPIAEAHKDAGVTISKVHLWGHPVEKIHECAKTDHAHMIFLGRRGRSRITDLLLGSVANSLAHTAGIPVVLVP